MARKKKRRINYKKQGNRFERTIAKLYRSIGYPKAATARATSKLHDDCGIDITGIKDFYVQTKYGKQTGIKYNELFKEYAKRISENDLDEDRMFVIHHSYNRREKRQPYDQLVILKESDWVKIVKKLNNIK